MTADILEDATIYGADDGQSTTVADLHRSAPMARIVIDVGGFRDP